MKISTSVFYVALMIMSLVQGMLSGCADQETRVPKPRAYPRIDFPERNFVSFQETDCPFTFQYPDYMHVVAKENFFHDTLQHPCWFDMDAPSLGAKLHCSYFDITPEKSLDQLITDAFKIADQINQRANYMDEIRVANVHGVSGLLMEFSGSAASPLHFFMTDSTTHFLKASLYFQSKVVPDSLAPITGFLREDLATMINSLDFD